MPYRAQAEIEERPKEPIPNFLNPDPPRWQSAAWGVGAIIYGLLTWFVEGGNDPILKWCAVFAMAVFGIDHFRRALSRRQEIALGEVPNLLAPSRWQDLLVGTASLGCGAVLA